jgi:transmembrane sensor
MSNFSIEDLLEKYKNNQCNEQELVQLENWYLQWKPDQALVSPEEINHAQQKAWAVISAEIKIHKTTVPLYRKIGLAAAVGIALLSAAIWFSNTPIGSTQMPTYANDVLPGGSGATLTLSNGRKIKLNSIKSGALAINSGLKILKTSDGKLVYEVSENAAVHHENNTLSTGNGETYQLILSDGTAVWLNAGSSITFSTNLMESGKRRLQLSGEAYFEVAKDQSHPFIVTTANQEVEVLGTHFNINAYPEQEEIRTTLLEGSVDVKAYGRHQLLIPGTEALNTGESIKVNPADPQLAVAWKNNKFVFNNEDIKSIMKEVARWYNVDVHYRGDIPDDAFEGSVSRFDRISKVLSILESTGQVHFEVEGRTIYVSKSTKHQ